MSSNLTPHGTIQILHVDDDPMVLEFVKEFVKPIYPEMEFTIVESPQTALELLHVRSFDCIISDYKMPEMDGLTFAAKVRESSDIPIILYTGQGSEEVAEKAFATGVDDYIRKENNPAHYQVLAKRIASVVEKKRGEVRNNELEQSTRERLEALQSHALVLSQCDDINAVAKTTYKILHDVMDYSFFGLGIVDGEVLRFTGVEADDDWSLEYPLDGSGICGKVVSRGSSIIVPDVRLDLDYISPKTGYKYLSEIVVPVKIGGKVVAIINVEDEKLNRFTKDDAILLEIFSEHVASSINRIELLNKTMKYIAKIKQINRHAAHLVNLNSVEEVAEYSFDVIWELLGFADSCIGIVEGDFLRFKYVRNLAINLIPDLPLDGKGITVRAYQTGKSQLIPDTRLDVDFVKDVDKAEFLSELDIPVKVDGRVVAVINLEDRKPNFFNDEDREIVEILSESIASAFSRIEHLKIIRASEKALSKSEERFKYILDSAPEGVTINVLGKVVYVNQHFAEMMGYAVDELLQKNVLEITKENYRQITKEYTRRRALGVAVPTQYEVELIRKDGSIIPVEYSASSIVYNGENASLTFIRNLTQKQEKLELEKKLVSLHTHARELNELQSIDEVAEVTLELLHNHLNCNLLSIRSVIGKYLHIIAEWGVKTTIGPMPIQWKSVVARAAREKKPILVKDTHLEPDFVNGGTDSLSELAVPILCRGELLGVLNAESLELNAFGENEKILMETLADEVGSVIVRIRSLELEHSYKNKLEALSSHASKLARCMDLEDIGKITLEIIHNVIGADYGSFSIIKNNQLSFVTKTGSFKSWRTDLPLEGPGITVKVARTGKAQLIADTRVEMDYLGSFENGIVFLSELVVPVEVGGEVKGVINLESLKENVFTDDDKRLVEFFTEHVASAISRIEHLEIIRASEEKYRRILESSLDAVFLLSGTKLLYANRKVAEFLGYDNVSELIGRDLLNVLPENEKEKIRQRALSRQRGEPQSDRFEFSLKRKDGATIEVEAAISLTEYEGKPAVLSFVRDISDGKRHQMKLIQLHGSGRRLVGASTRDEIWDIAIETVTQILGFDFAGIGVVEANIVKYIRSVGAELPKDWSIDLSKPSITSRAIETGIPQLVKDTSLDPDYLSVPGVERHSSEIVIPIIVDERPVAVLNIESNQPSIFNEIDLSLIQILVSQISLTLDRLTHFEEDIKSRESRQRELLEGMERMSSMVRHDLRGPLQTIQSASYLLRHRPDRAEELTRKIDEGVDYAVRILDDLKTMTKPEALNKLSTNLSDLVEKSLDSAIIPATVSVVRNLAPVSLEVDQYRIRRVVDNLIKNAIEAMPDGGALTLRVEASDGMALLTVKDTGRGISDETARNLFTPFYTTKQTGTGLGLVICKQVVEAHCGKITFKSRVGDGTVFTVALPLTTYIPSEGEEMSGVPSRNLPNSKRSSNLTKLSIDWLKKHTKKEADFACMNQNLNP